MAAQRAKEDEDSFVWIFQPSRIPQEYGVPSREDVSGSPHRVRDEYLITASFPPAVGTNFNDMQPFYYIYYIYYCYYCYY